MRNFRSPGLLFVAVWALCFSLAGCGGGPKNSSPTPANPGIAGTPGTNPTDGAAMVWVPGGSFTMGCPSSIDNGYASNGETQQTTLSGYWIYTNEVTVAQYRAFCAATGYALPYYPGNYGYTPWSQRA